MDHFDKQAVKNLIVLKSDLIVSKYLLAAAEKDTDDATVAEQLFPPGKVSDLQQRLEKKQRGNQPSEAMIGKFTSL